MSTRRVRIADRYGLRFPTDPPFTVRAVRFFAVGSNTDTELLRSWIPSARRLTIASLPGFALRWHKRSSDGGKLAALRTGHPMTSSGGSSTRWTASAGSTSPKDNAKAFYEALGWRGQEVEETVFFQAGGMAVTLWGRANLSEDAAVHDVEGQRRIDGIALAHNVSTPSEVDEILAAAKAAGARVTRPAHETFYGGYSGYFSDPDGHLWEIAHNPGFTLHADGTLTLPDFGRG